MIKMATAPADNGSVSANFSYIMMQKNTSIPFHGEDYVPFLIIYMITGSLANGIIFMWLMLWSKRTPRLKPTALNIILRNSTFFDFLNCTINYPIIADIFVSGKVDSDGFICKLNAFFLVFFGIERYLLIFVLFCERFYNIFFLRCLSYSQGYIISILMWFVGLIITTCVLCGALRIGVFPLSPICYLEQYTNDITTFIEMVLGFIMPLYIMFLIMGLSIGSVLRDLWRRKVYSQLYMYQKVDDDLNLVQLKNQELQAAISSLGLSASFSLGFIVTLFCVPASWVTHTPLPFDFIIALTALLSPHHLPFWLLVMTAIRRRRQVREAFFEDPMDNIVSIARKDLQIVVWEPGHELKLPKGSILQDQVNKDMETVKASPGSKLVILYVKPKSLDELLFC